MENITFTLSEMQRTLVSINAYLAAFAEEVENKKKKVDKKKKSFQEKKRNIYTKKTNGQIEISKEYKDAMSTSELNFHESMINDYPELCEMSEILTFDQYRRLCSRYNRRDVISMMGQLANYSKKSNYISVYKVLNNWLSRNFDK